MPVSDGFDGFCCGWIDVAVTNPGYPIVYDREECKYRLTMRPGVSSIVSYDLKYCPGCGAKLDHADGPAEAEIEDALSAQPD